LQQSDQLLFCLTISSFNVIVINGYGSVRFGENKPVNTRHILNFKSQAKASCENIDV